MDGRTARRTERRFRAHPASVGEARRLVRTTLADAGRDDLAETAELLLSEVVTNAVVHAATPVDVEAVAGEGGLRVEVGDDSPHLPIPRAYGGLSGTGRGLRMLEELADAWGVQPRPPGKTVWFELQGADGRGQSEGSAADTNGPTAVRSGVEVALLNVPLLLHSAWQVHAESLLREYLLMRLDEAPDALAELEAHAAVNDAMSLLRERIVAPDIGSDPEALLAAATEPLVTAERITLSVPEGSVAHFTLLDQTLDAVLALADAGALLTAPTQPELRMMRRWLCRQVLEQAAGKEATAWDMDGHLPPPQQGDVAWAGQDLDEVASADRAMVASDDTNRILAVSAPALALLGYTSSDALVGHRLVEIIPHRYRQAHLAGFTLHLSTGRSPLLSRPVTVPALRHGGTETTVVLTISVRHQAGRSLFVAELQPARVSEDAVRRAP